MKAYRLRSMGDSSHKYGPCTVCGIHAHEMFRLVEMERGEPWPAELLDLVQPRFRHFNGPKCETYVDTGRTVYGHRDCVIKQAV